MPKPTAAAASACADVESGASRREAPEAADSPRHVTRGEREPGSPEERTELALVDWLGFTAHSGKPDDWAWMRGCLHDIFEVPADFWTDTGKQWHGYKHRADLIQSSGRGESLHVGLVAWGGDSQRGTVHVELYGQACARFVSWSEVRAWAESIGAWITRVDVAHDDFEGETVNIEQAKAWREEGGFGGGGRPPRARLIDDLGSGEGKTLYVGKRAYGKLCRVYEKGKQEGDPNSPWCRVEVEFRNKSRIIPWDILSRPGDYLAGAFPCLAYLSVHQERIKTIRHTAAIQYPQMVNNVRTLAGRSLNVMYSVEHGNAAAVLRQVMRQGIPKRLEGFAGLQGVLEEVAHADPQP